VHGSPFNIDVIVDSALGTDGPTKSSGELFVDEGASVDILGGYEDDEYANTDTDTGTGGEA
jgi:hypothetical protein